MERILVRIAIALSLVSIVALLAVVFAILPNETHYKYPAVVYRPAPAKVVQIQDEVLTAYDAFRSTDVYRKAVEADRGVRIQPEVYIPQSESTGTVEDGKDTIIIDTTELDCLHKNIYWEGRNQPEDGKIAIATVTLNRAKSHKFGDTICEVVYDARKDSSGQILRHKCQFSWYCDGLKDEPDLANGVERKAWRKAREVAEGVMLGQYYAAALNADTLYYHATTVKPYWAKRKVRVATVAGHVFYRDRFKSRKS